MIVEARSHDPYGEDFTCSIRLNLTFTDPADKTVYVTPDKVSARYYTVFPGKASIPLYDYAIGPNITYEVEHPDPALAPETVVLQQNSSRLTWKEVPSNIVFYRQFEHFENFSSVVVAQDGADLSLHVADCFHSDPEY